MITEEYLGNIISVLEKIKTTQKDKMLKALPDFPKWLSLSDKLKWWKIKLGIKKDKSR